MSDAQVVVVLEALGVRPARYRRWRSRPPAPQTLAASGGREMVLRRALAEKELLLAEKELEITVLREALRKAG